MNWNWWVVIVSLGLMLVVVLVEGLGDKFK